MTGVPAAHAKIWFGVLRLLRRQRDRCRRQELLQLRHRRQQLARRQPRQRMPARARWMRRRLGPGHVARGGPGREQHARTSSPSGTSRATARARPTTRPCQPLWDDLYAAGVDILLDGHDHIYERTVPMKSGATLASPPVADPTYGIPQFTVGTGGEAHHGLATPLPTSVVRNDETFGIMKLTLHATTYDWKFLPIAGSTFTDSGTGSVHGAPPPISPSGWWTMDGDLTTARAWPTMPASPAARADLRGRAGRAGAVAHRQPERVRARRQQPRPDDRDDPGRLDPTGRHRQHDAGRHQEGDERRDQRLRALALERRQGVRPPQPGRLCRHVSDQLHHRLSAQQHRLDARRRHL